MSAKALTGQERPERNADLTMPFPARAHFLHRSAPIADNPHSEIVGSLVSRTTSVPDWKTETQELSMCHGARQAKVMTE